MCKMGKNILFIVDHLIGGGAERMTLELAENLSATNTVSIALMNSDSIGMNLPLNIDIHNLHINNDFMSGGLWKRKNKKLHESEIQRINKLIQSRNPDLIILSHWYAMYLEPFLHGNVWIWVHGDIFQPIKKKTTNLFRWYKETRNHYFCMKNFPKALNGKKLIFVNNDLYKNYKPYLPDSTIKVIYNGINFEKFKNDFRKEKIWDCIFLGRLSKEKQPDYAIRAFFDSKLQGRMAIVGDGPMKEELINLAEELKVIDRIDFVGWVNNVQDYICQSKILILSSKEESFGLVISEALCLGTPVVAFNCSDGVSFQLHSERLRRGLVQPQDRVELAKKLREVYEKPYEIIKDDLMRLSIKNMKTEFEKLLKL